MFDGSAATVIGKRVGNYVVERTLARGGMGSVFVARHPALGREAAVKFLDEDFEAPSELSKRFLDEARITANLRHPNIVDIFDFGELDGRLYYVMELLDGYDLAALMRERGRFTVDEVIDFLWQICSGLAAAHAVGVVHRDLKPGNIFVVRGEPPRLKLMDFGVAKIMTSAGEQTRYGQIIGTPRYMSPEQALGQIDRITPQSDIYSLGAIAYEMIAGVAPFEHQSPVMLLAMHVRDQFRPLDQLTDGAPRELTELTEACLAKDPAARPPSAQHILEQIAGLRRESGIKKLQVPRQSESNQRCGEWQNAAPSPAAPASTERPVGLNALSAPMSKAASEMSEPADVPVAQDHSPGSSLVPDGEPTIDLTESDHTALNRLLSRMQRQGDLPAFVQNVGEVSKRADFESSFSAEQLGTAILRDFALTARLLRVVNSAYASRFGGKVYSVQHAIVLLGFDRVRSVALATSIFKDQASAAHTERISESAVSSLVSGEIARQLSVEAGIDDPEQAMICAMFRNLGRHLVLVYLPELYDEVVALVEQQRISLTHAAERVLGISLYKLGVGVAERWCLPPKITAAMSTVPRGSLELRRDEDKLAALAEFSNQLCKIVASDTGAEERAASIKALLIRHKNLIKLNPGDVTKLLQIAQHSLEQRYKSVLGPATKTSRFSRTVASLSGQSPVREAAESADDNEPIPLLAAPTTVVSREEPPLANLLPKVEPRVPSRPYSIHPERPRLEVTRIQLAKVIDPSEAAAVPTDDFHARALSVAAAQALAEHGRAGSSEQLLQTVLTAVARYLGVPRILALRATNDRRSLAIVGGVGDDIDGLTKQLRFPLTPSRTATDPFSLCYHANRDFYFEDVFFPKVTAVLPQCYYEAIGSKSLAILATRSKGPPPLVLTIDVDPPDRLPSIERVIGLDLVRPALAQIAPLATR
jgi:serine/threonine protein kinase